MHNEMIREHFLKAAATT